MSQDGARRVNSCRARCHSAYLRGLDMGVRARKKFCKFMNKVANCVSSPKTLGLFAVAAGITLIVLNPVVGATLAGTVTFGLGVGLLALGALQLAKGIYKCCTNRPQTNSAEIYS